MKKFIFLIFVIFSFPKINAYFDKPERFENTTKIISEVARKSVEERDAKLLEEVRNRTTSGPIMRQGECRRDFSRIFNRLNQSQRANLCVWCRTQNLQLNNQLCPQEWDPYS